MSKPKVLAIVGPTASGKSAFAVALAKRWNGEIISADSRQVYRGMDIGTGKVAKREMRGIPHHLLGVASPKRTFTVAQYQKLARAAVKKILAKGKLPIVAGGTGLYVDALLYNYHFPAIKPDFALRKKLEQQTPEKLFARLERLDPRRAATIERHNMRRLVRALEIVLTTKKPVPELRGESPYEALKVGLNPPLAVLRKKIHARLLKRLRQGMVREVRILHEKQGVSWKRLDDFGLEYRYVSRYLRGLLSKQEMTDEIEKESMRYAKRQMTWFKRDHATHWIRKSRTIPLLPQHFFKEFCE